MIHHNHFKSRSFSNCIFSSRCLAVDSVSFVDGLGSENISTSINDAVSLPDSIKHPPFPSNNEYSFLDCIFDIMFCATVIASPSANIPAFGTVIVSVTVKVVTSPTAYTFSNDVLQSLLIGINPPSFANPES